MSKEELRSRKVNSPNRKYTLKKEYYPLIAKNFNLRERISESIGGSATSVALNAKSESYRFLDINALMIIAKFYDKELFDILDVDTEKPF